jgi:hypothetical protein
MTQSQSDKRTTERIVPFVSACHVRDGKKRPLSGYVTEISAHGARVVCEKEPPAPGSQVTLDVRFKGRVASMHLAAEVKWVRPIAAAADEHQYRFAFGLSFSSGATAEDRRLLEEIVNAFRQRAAELVGKS